MTTAVTPTTPDRIDVSADTSDHHRSTTIAASDLISAANASSRTHTTRLLNDPG